MKKLLIAIAAAGLLATGGAPAHAALGVDFDKPTNDFLQTSEFPGSIAGWSFTANRDLYVRALGIYDHDPDAFHAESHNVGLWKADGTLLQAVSIYEPQYSHQQELVAGKYHFATTEAVLLKAGQTYIIGSTVQPDSFAMFPDQLTADSHNLQFDANITYLGGRYASSASLVMPESTLGGIGYFGANIDVVPTPVPAAAWLLGSGLLGLVGLKRRQQA